MTDEVVNSVVNGSYYYAIHVDSEAISPLNMERFLEPEVEGAPVDTVLQGFLEGLKGDGNPRSHIDSDIGDFDFERMSSRGSWSYLYYGWTAVPLSGKSGQW